MSQDRLLTNALVRRVLKRLEKKLPPGEALIWARRRGIRAAVDLYKHSPRAYRCQMRELRHVVDMVCRQMNQWLTDGILLRAEEEYRQRCGAAAPIDLLVDMVNASMGPNHIPYVYRTNTGYFGMRAPSEDDAFRDWE